MGRSEEWFDGEVPGEIKLANTTWAKRAVTVGLALRPTLVEGIGEDVPPVAPTLGPDSRLLLADAEVGLRLGRASWRVLRPRMESALEWAEKHHQPGRAPFRAFAYGLLVLVWRDFIAQTPANKCARELDDERARAQATTHDDGLLRYLYYWRRRLQRLQVAWPGRWRVPGLTSEELVDLLEVELLQGIRDGAVDRFESAGAEATFIFLARRCDSLRTARKVYIVPTGWSSPETAATVPTPLGLLESASDADAAERIIAEAKRTLQPPLRVWLQACEKHIRLGDRHDLNLSEVAASLRKNRSSATRALRGIRRALARRGARDVLGSW